jgi:hypothetical protein
MRQTLVQTQVEFGRNALLSRQIKLKFLLDDTEATSIGTQLEIVKDKLQLMVAATLLMLIFLLILLLILLSERGDAACHKHSAALPRAPAAARARAQGKQTLQPV